MTQTKNKIKKLKALNKRLNKTLEILKQVNKNAYDKRRI